MKKKLHLLKKVADHFCEAGMTKVTALAIALSLFINPAFPVAFASDVQYHSEGRRDPFVPLVGPNGMISRQIKTSDIQIEGIIFDPQGGSVAVINGEVYRPGESVKEARIVQIFKDRIILVQEDEEKTVWLREEIANPAAAKENEVKSKPA